jgi:hypothetical protein
MQAPIGSTQTNLNFRIALSYASPGAGLAAIEK